MSSLRRSITAAVFILFVPLWGGCEKSDSDQAARKSDHDDALRAYLGIRSLRGPFSLPPSTKGYYPVALIFENGEEVGRTAGVMIGLGTPKETVSGEVQLLMSSKDRRAFLYHGGNSSELGGKIDWTQFGGASAWGSSPVAQEIRYQDVLVRAVFATAPGLENTPSISLDDHFPKSGAYVIAIGVVYGDDFDALRKKFESESKYQPPKRAKSEAKAD